MYLNYFIVVCNIIHTYCTYYAHVYFQGYSITPLVSVKLELLQHDVAFVPALDSLTSDPSIPETVKTWLTDYLQACGQAKSWRKDQQVCVNIYVHTYSMYTNILYMLVLVDCTCMQYICTYLSCTGHTFKRLNTFQGHYYQQVCVNMSYTYVCRNVQLLICTQTYCTCW